MSRKKKRHKKQTPAKTEAEIQLEKEQELKKKQYKDAVDDISTSRNFIIVGIVIMIIVIIVYAITTGAKHQSTIAAIDRVESLGTKTLVGSSHVSTTYKYNYYVHFIWNGQEYHCVTMATLQSDHPASVGSEVKVYFDESIEDGARVDLELEHTYFKWIMVFYFDCFVVSQIISILADKSIIKAIESGKDIKKVNKFYNRLFIACYLSMVVLGVYFFSLH